MAKSKEDIIALMTATFQEGNRELCKQFGMSDQEIDEKVNMAEQTISFLLSNVYESLEKEGIVS